MSGDVYEHEDPSGVDVVDDASGSEGWSNDLDEIQAYR